MSNNIFLIRWTATDNAMLLENGRSVGASCSTCTGSGSLAKGYHAEVIGTVESLNPPKIAVTSVKYMAPGGSGCDGFVGGSPSAPAPAPSGAGSSSASGPPAPASSSNSSSSNNNNDMLTTTSDTAGSPGSSAAAPGTSTGSAQQTEGSQADSSSPDPSSASSAAVVNLIVGVVMAVALFAY